jgi:hypothetical protein
MTRLLCAGFLAFVSVANAQSGLATITGTVSDSTGAVVADAPVEVRNLGNGQLSAVATTSTGNFTISQLPIGDYTLTIGVRGFKRYVHENFHLALSQTMREDVSLKVGETAESITVSADASLLKTESSQVAANVTLAQLNTLPLLTVAGSNAGYRNPWASANLMPGIQYTGTGPIENIRVNGTPVNTLQTRLDGLTIGPTSTRLLGALNAVQPSVDAVEEVSVLTSNFAAEFGTSGGAMVTLTTKSGTNKFHGSAYDYATNEVLNAHQPYTGLRNRVRQTDWGFTFGGPVRIPKLYDGTNKTFFFWSYEQYREKKTVTTGVTTVPTLAYRNGDFSDILAQENRLVRTSAGNFTDPLGRTIASGTIFDPATQRQLGNVLVREPFVGNRIPVSRYDPIAVKVLALVPQPFGVNSTKQAGDNYQAPYKLSRLSAIPSIKLDHNIGTKLRLSFYWQRTHSDAPRSPTAADNFPDLLTAGFSTGNAGRTIRLNTDYTATPRLMLHLGLGYNDEYTSTSSAVTDYDSFKELGLTGQTKPRNFPRIGTSTQSVSVGGLSPLGLVTQQLFWERRPSLNATGTYAKGNHTFKIGAEGRQERFPDNNYSGTNGTYNFASAQTEQTALQGSTISQGFTGFNFASFLLGEMSSATQAAEIAARTSKLQVALYAQDTWKLTRKLTLDYGLRWDYGTYTREQYGRYSTFSPTVPNPSASGRLGARLYESVCDCNFAANYPYAIGPRLGFAYHASSKTVIRGGIGVVYNSTSTATGSSVNTSTTGAAAFGQSVGQFRDGIPAYVRAVWPTTEPSAGQAVGTVGTAPTYLDANAGRPARLLQYSLSLQRELTPNLVVEGAYVANRGTWWDAGALVSLNALSEPTLRAYGFNDFTSSSEAALLTTTIANLSATQRATLASRGINGLPYANYPSSQTVRASLTPFPQYSGSPLVTGAPLGNTWYDSFQLTLTKRFSRGLSLNMNYTYSKTLELLSATDVFNRANGKAIGATDLPQQLRITAQYQVPTFKNSKLPLVSNRVVAYALSGWGIGMYASYQSAPALARPASTSTTPISQFLGRGPGTAQRRRDADGNYMNPWSIDWTDYDGVHHTDPININCHCFDPTKTLVFNPNAWENIPNGQWGPQQTPFRDYRGIRLPQENANFSRNFSIKEGISLNVRVEFTNILNRTQLPNPSAAGAFATPATKFSSGVNTGLYSGGFGSITPLSGTTGQRAGSFVARVTF